MKKLGLLLISSAFLFVGCGTKNEAAKQNSETTESSITTTTTSSNKENASSKRETASSESTSTTTSSTTETASSESTTPASSSTATDSSEVSSTSQTSTEQTAVTNEFPYAVNPERFNTPTTFQFRGMNVPASVTLENDGQTTIMTSAPKSGGEATVYTASIETIPTQSIRIYSYSGNIIRTVKVNTKINLLNKTSSANTSDESGPFYVFENSNGGLSLITPNYAGNASEGQSDVMVEAVQ